MTGQGRVQAGVPTGGQFAPGQHAEAATSLSAPQASRSSGWIAPGRMVEKDGVTRTEIMRGVNGRRRYAMTIDDRRGVVEVHDPKAGPNSGLIASAAYSAEDFDSKLSAIDEAQLQVEQQEQPEPTMLLRADGRVTMRDALRQLDKERPARAEIVMTYNDKHDDHDMPQIRPPDGTVLIIENRSGFFQHEIVGGRVVVRANSSFGNPIKVRGGDVHIVTDGMSRKVSIDIEPDDPERPPVITIGEEDAADPRSRINAWMYRAKPTLSARSHDSDDAPVGWSEAAPDTSRS